ncbi:MAG: penicillin acylase family protein [Gemmatimonadetes bacterium]|nr:penicillin acylase family protein [Gemmatimonadota bacterium]
MNTRPTGHRATASPAAHLALIGAVAVVGAGVLEASQNGFDRLARESLAQLDGTLDVPGLRHDVEVLRDRWGIPHIYAQNEADMFFAQGYVQAQDRLWQIDMWRRTNEGRLSEILGPEAFEHDRLARLIMYRGSWDAEFSSYHPNGRQIFEAFANGVNAFIDAAGDNLPVEYKLTGLRPLRWTPEASTGRVATALPISAARAELMLARRIARSGIEQVNRQEAPGRAAWIELRIPDGLDVFVISQEAVDALGHFRSGFPRPPVLPEYRKWEDALTSENRGAQEDSPGSNNWVVSGALTASGNVLLANDPHRGVTNPSLRYLVHLNAPGYSVIGATEPAIPGVAIGHNGRIGWGLTIVGTDQADVFVEELNPANLNEARWRGEWYPLRTVIDTIPVRGEAPRIVRHRFSRNGPVFHVDSIHHLAYAVRSTSNEPGSGGYLAALRLAEAENCHEFIDVMAYYHAPSENMMCGDVNGNIAWLAAALSPRRTAGWYGRLPVPGTGRYEWEGFRSHTELPQEFNPDRGWIATANNDIQPPGYYPPLMFPRGPSARRDRIDQMFAGASRLTAEDFELMANDAVYPWIVSDRPLFTGWVADDALVEWARMQLAAWDGTYHRSSPEAALHRYWLQELDEEARADDTSQDRRRALSATALAAAVDSLVARQGSDRSQWRWGRIHRSEFPHWLVAAYDLPAVERNGGGGTIAATGATFREIIDFADFDNSRVTSAPGQSGQPGSPFYGNLLPLWANGQFFPLLFSRDAVDGRTTHRLELRAR